MRSTFTLLAIAAAALAATTARADPALTGVPATMRAAPTAQARVVQRIPANAQIDLSGCRDAWCYVSWRDLFGYIPARAVEAAPYPAGGPPPPPAYGAPPPVVVAPVVGFGWGRGRRW